ncbi:ATP-dependent helicase [Senegalia massiliensis]|uniref:DNA 3'-5' helicase n=1 Tax=Senegalia massiliensis TaxID=1720316 RepID=A0A845QUJ4_9CLOT|nr:ATP-dependent helicase [Senegalia massiliensis]
MIYFYIIDKGVSLLSNNFFDNLSSNFNINLNPQQREAVLHKNGPALVLAVPGAGKTTVLISRTANLILNHNINPQNILSVTFSKASAIDMKSRFSKVFGNNLDRKVHFSTIHSFAYSVIRYYSKISNDYYTLIEGKNSPVNKISILKKLYMELNNSMPSEEKLEELLNAVGFVKNMLLNKEDFTTYKKLKINNFKKIYAKYESYKKQNNYIDFDDMLSLTISIFEKNPLILSNLKQRYQYIQVDEGQDTSRAQHKIIRLLSSPKNNLFIVADDDQSIYGFRGAYPEYLLNFEKNYSHSKKFFMEQNYRSSSNIVDTSNKFITNNTIRYSKNLYTENSEESPVTIIKFKDEKKQYEYLFDNLKNNSHDSAILFRNNISTISIVDGLLKNNIPFFVRDSNITFFNHWIVRDILSFIKLSYDETDINSFEKIYYRMNGYISKKQISFIKSKNIDESIFNKLLNFPDLKIYQKNNIKRIRDKFKVIRKLNAKTAIDSILYDLEYDEFLRKNSKRYGQSYENIKIIISTIKLICRDLESPILLIDRLNYIKKSLYENRDFGEEKVRLSTFHSAKGLEFERVFMIDLIDNEFPNSNSIDEYEMGNKKPLEEERRLFYVGMTRAKKDLKLLTYKSRDGEEVLISRFVAELERIISNQSLGINNGDNIVHKSFGKGIVLDIDKDILTIKFEKYGKKKVSLSLSMENNLLKVV